MSQTGNWGEFKIDADGDGSYDDAGDLDQNRSHNDVNEITGITEDFGAAWADPAHDLAGNMTTVPKPTDMTATYTGTYDAWNRLVEVKSGQTTVGKYEYDGLGRRIKKHIDSQSPGAPDGVDTYRHFFYNASWQIVETRESDSENTEPETLQPEYQYVWSLRYIDAPVLRDKNTDADDLCDDQRLYYLNDANMNVTALVNTSGTVVERYMYDAYGKVTVLDADWSVDADGVSDFGNEILYCGYRYDPETGLYHVRYRYYHTSLGRWVTIDPIKDGLNLYEYVGSKPVGSVDPNGTERITGKNSVDEILRALREAIKRARARNWGVAAANLEHWLGESKKKPGGDQWISADWLLKDPLVRSMKRAMRMQYWEGKTLAMGQKAADLKRGKVVVDYWDKHISYRKVAKHSGTPSNELAYASGDSTLQGHGIFVGCVGGDKNKAEGYVRYLWWDEYDFHKRLYVKFPGGRYMITDSALLKVKKAGHGKRFYMYAMWLEKLECTRIGKRWHCRSSRVPNPVPTSRPSTSPSASQPAKPQPVIKPTILSGSPTLATVRLRGRVVNWNGTRVLHYKQGDKSYWGLSAK